MVRYHVMMIALALAATATLGCDKPKPNRGTVQVQGTVTIGGNPIPPDAQASIYFGPTDASQASSSSASIIDGKFNAEGVPKGKVLVTFTIMQPTGEQKAFAPGARKQMDMRSLVPTAKANGVERQVSDNNAILDFDL